MSVEPVPLIIHERLGNWSRQLRPRLTNVPVRVIESRARHDLLAHLGSSSTPILVADVPTRERPTIDDLVEAIVRNSEVMTLAIDSDARPAVKAVLREIGVTHVLSGFAPPPLVAALVTRWIDVVKRREASQGWNKGVSTADRVSPLDRGSPHWVQSYLKSLRIS